MAAYCRKPPAEPVPGGACARQTNLNFNGAGCLCRQVQSRKGRMPGWSAPFHLSYTKRLIAVSRGYLVNSHFRPNAVVAITQIFA